MSGFHLPAVILITLCGCCGAAPASKHVCDDLANQNLIISNTEAPGEEVMVGYRDSFLFLNPLQRLGAARTLSSGVLPTSLVPQHQPLKIIF